VAVIELDSVSKAFWLPAVRRETVREHVLGALRRQRYERLQVLDGVSFAVDRGEAVAIMGRNGSGKSTLLKILCGVYQADRGRIRVASQITPILELGVGWNPELDAVDNVLLIGSVMGLTLHEIRKRMEAILAFAELERFANLKVKHFSSGMAARLGYAVAFEAVREILILDEIFAVGDEGFKARCESRYAALRRAGHTVLLVSHVPAIVTAFCDRAVLLDRGRIVMNDVAGRVAERYVAMLRGEVGREPAHSPPAPASDGGPPGRDAGAGRAV
jgi:ABC-type polysaccharide/polyol phosphate transport system ATPase subunit